MTALLGTASLWLAFACAVLGSAALVAGHRRGRAAWVAAGAGTGIVLFGLATLAVVLMEIALVRFDFSIRYVANTVNRATPLLFRVIALWGALEGSILLWLWVLAGFTAAVAVRYRRRHPEVMPQVLAVLLGISAFFLLLMAGPANPFARLAVAPADGRGLNPLLQNHPLMAVHPPLLYLGYVGFAVPYAFAMATLITGRLGDEWMAVTRRWTLLAWTCLTAGLLLGARWSYDVLGWGGYWAWDPVENAAFLPWLVATALIHSSMVQERRRLLRVWNLTLVILAFLLTIFGTFLTRSGVLASVHSFTQSLIGPLFVAFLAVALAASLAALLARLPAIRDAGTFDSYLSREALIVLNNVVLLAMAFTVFAGTIAPLVIEAATGARVTVGPPFFNRLFVPLGVLLLLLMGVGTALRWGRSSRRESRRIGLLLLLAVVAAGAVALAGVRGPATVVSLWAVAFMALAQVGEFVDGIRAARAGGLAWLPAVQTLFGPNPRRYYGYLVHLGLAVVIVGIVGSQASRLEVHRRIASGQMTQVGAYALRLEGLEAYPRRDKLVVAARVAVFTDAGLAQAAGGTPAPAAMLLPSENFYRQTRTPVASPAVRSTWREDLYVVLMAFDPDEQSAVLRIVISPLVTWIWIGGAIMVAAGAMTIWPSRRG